MTQHEHWQHTGIIPAAEFEQSDDYTETAPHKARIAALCAATAVVIVIGAAMVGGLG